MNAKGSGFFLRVMVAMLVVVLFVSCAPAVKVTETPVETLPPPTVALPTPTGALATPTGALATPTVALPPPTVALPPPTVALPTPTGAPVSKDELRIQDWGDINTLDPAFMTSTEREFTIMNCIYSGLVKYKLGSWDIEPDLALSWDISTDNKQITFHLRKGVQFQNGYGELTADDVKFSFERIIDPAQKSPEADTWAALDHVEVIDPYTAKLVLKNPSASLFTSALPLNAGFIVSKKAVEKMGIPTASIRWERDHTNLTTGLPGKRRCLWRTRTILERHRRSENSPLSPLQRPELWKMPSRQGRLTLAGSR